MASATQLKVLGAICDAQERPLQLRCFGLPRAWPDRGAEMIVVAGSGTQAGTTMLTGAIMRALRRTGFRVAAARVTGTADSNIRNFMRSCGAQQVLDFTDAGYPSTYLLPSQELQQIYTTLIGTLQQQRPDYILVELSDSMFQRESRMLLDNAELRVSFDHIIFAAGDSLAAESGMRRLLSRGLPLRALSGAFTQSPLVLAEAEAYTGMPCLSIEQIEQGALSLVLPSRLATARVADVIQLWRCA